MKKNLKKTLFRFLTPKTWRFEKRRKIFQKIFEDLTKNSKGTRGSFTFVEDDGLSYGRSCRAMARSHDYNPIFDRVYGEMNIGKYFDKYQLQNFDSLYAVIKRLSPSWRGILLGSCTFKVIVSGRENGEPFKFFYEKRVKI